MQIKSLTHSRIDVGRSNRSRIYIWPEGETIMDNLQNRRTRPYSVFRKQVIPQVLEQLGWPADTKVSWSQRAGCQCGCSPGFIVNDTRCQSVHVTVV